MKIFYDTEFIEDGKTIDLISIGMVREDGAEYYAVNAGIAEYDPGNGGKTALYPRICGHKWLCENVIPHLPLAGREKKVHRHQNGPYYYFLDTASTLVKPKYVIANEVRDFILTAPDPQLWAWYAAYDHVALCQLWGPMISLPKGVPMWTNDLRQECMRLGNPQVPEQEGAEHNALDDARHARAIWEFLHKHEIQLTQPAALIELRKAGH